MNTLQIVVWSMLGLIVLKMMYGVLYINSSKFQGVVSEGLATILDGVALEAVRSPKASNPNLHYFTKQYLAYSTILLCIGYLIIV